MADTDALSRLLEALKTAADDSEGVPTGSFQRLRKTAGAAARAGTSHLLGRLRGAQEPDLEAIHRLVLSLGQLKGVAMKVGQILSYVDPTMQPQLRELLAVLQKNSQPTPFPTVEAVLRAELGERAEVLLRAMDRAPVASASIGQVHRTVLEDGRVLAVKVQHPNIDQAIRSDFRSAQAGKALVKLIAPSANAAALIDEAEEMFLEECDYLGELKRQARFAQLFEADPDLQVPAVFPEFSSRKVLTSEWKDGIGWERFLAEASPEARSRAGRSLYRFYVGSVYRHGLFNGDPHPGNLLFADDGRVTLLDYGCVREFDANTVESLARLSAAVRRGDRAGMREAFVRLGAARPPNEAAMDTTQKLLRGFFGPVLVPGVRKVQPDVAIELRELIGNKRAMLKLRIPPRLLFLFRIRFGLHALLARLEAEVDWAALEAELAAAALPASGPG